ncbi:regulator of nonsense transcripts 2-like [Diadema setosum]|uniref:regulator of nonsense transcripts 2-like n=1 Tax=Diadema setosum TaxID=31175 RepID=UPI003B3A7970
MDTDQGGNNNGSAETDETTSTNNPADPCKSPSQSLQTDGMQETPGQEDRGVSEDGVSGENKESLTESEHVGDKGMASVDIEPNLTEGETRISAGAETETENPAEPADQPENYNPKSVENDLVHTDEKISDGQVAGINEDAEVSSIDASSAEVEQGEKATASHSLECKDDNSGNTISGSDDVIKSVTKEGDNKAGNGSSEEHAAIPELDKIAAKDPAKVQVIPVKVDKQSTKHSADADTPSKERGGKSYSAQRSGSRGGKRNEEEAKKAEDKNKTGKAAPEAKGSDGRAVREENRRGQRKGNDGKEKDRSRDPVPEQGGQRSRDRDKDRDREREKGREKQRGDQNREKVADRRRETDSRGSKRKEEDHHHKSKSREDRMKEEEEKRKKEEEAKKIENEKKKEEERIRLEEEKKKKEEEQKRMEEEAARRREEEEEKLARETHAEALERKETKMATRTKNLGASSNWPDEDFFVKLDSSLKKNTAFIRKLKMLTEQQRDSLAKEFQGLNLTKYVGEAAIAFCEAKLKMADIGCAIYLCSLFHQRYSEFSTQLLQGIQRALPPPVKKEDKDAKQPIIFDSKIRVELRFLAELIVGGIFTEKEGVPLLNNLLSSIMKADKENHNNISIIISFTKHCGEDYAGIVPRKQRLLAEKFQLGVVTPEVFSSQLQTAYRNLLKDHYGSLAKFLQRQHKDLQNMERQNRRTLQNKGELSEERRKKLEEKQTAYQKLLMNTSNFADLIDEDMPDLPVEELSKDELDILTIDMMGSDGQLSEFDWANSLWEDEDTRTFHENLINLRSMVPAILFKDADQRSVNRPGDKEDEKLEKLEDDIKALEIATDEEETVEEGDQDAAGEEEQEQATETKQEEEMALEEIDPAEGDEDADEGEQISNATLKMLMDAYINSLPQCVNRDHIDKAAVDFCLNLNTKANRKKLAKALFNVPRTRLDLLPFYSRLVATLYVCMPDIAEDLVERLKNEFRWHVRKKDQMMVESKIKVARFIGELTKFKMCSKADTLQCLKSLIQDFRHHNIDMTCALLESCGRFLYRSPESHLKTNALLELMMRKKSKMVLGERHNTMVDNAFFYCNPPEVTKIERKVRPPMHEYIRKLLFKDLSKTTVEKVLKQMRKLPWDTPEIKQYTVKCLSSVWNLKYNNVHCLANLLAGLVQYHDDAGIRVVDAILEDVRIGMEINHPKYNQRRVTVVKFLGELYNYRLVESSVIFKTLYSLIRFGVTLDGVESPLDPPEHLFRIRLVCTLLDTCGQFFDRGSSKKKLDCFLVYFQQYIWYKRNLPNWNTEGRPFPMDVDNAISDTLEMLRPKLKLFVSLEEAHKEVAQLEKDQVQKITNIIPEIQLNIVQPPAGGQGLMPIMEGNEDQVELSQGVESMSLNDDDDDLSDGELGESGGRHRRADRNSATNSQSQNTGEEQEEPYNDYGDDNFALESAGENEEDDHVTVITGGPKLMACEEDENFTEAFDKMLSENIQQRNAESMKVAQLDIGVPLHIKARTSAKPMTFNPFQPQLSPEDPSTVNFVLMTRKGNKQHFREFEVPINSELASNLKNREQAERAEKQRMKELTLHINERQEEEDYEEMLASLQRPAISVPKEHKPRFHHPKGAPDTEQIFNAKGNRKW